MLKFVIISHEAFRKEVFTEFQDVKLVKKNEMRGLRCVYFRGCFKINVLFETPSNVVFCLYQFFCAAKGDVPGCPLTPGMKGYGRP